ncbi:hypothetical protein [Arthrobacter flavus]|uniref:Uncharacterized protein n=1 Tax=Arthrobacter flavus TaxID=95172 RepID=A0ABW4Q9B4_9MICC
MDPIEQLIREIDPVRTETLYGGSDSNRSELLVFSDDQGNRIPSVVPLNRRRRWAAAIAAIAAAAAVGVAVVVSGNFGAVSPLPADQPNPAVTGSAEPSAVPTPTAPVSTGTAESSAEPTPTTPTAPVPAGSPLATYTPEGEGSAAASLTGTLILEGDCVYIRAAETLRYVAYFPNTDASWSDGVLSFFGTTYELGQEIAVGGGDLSGVIPVDGTEGYYTPESCVADNQWVVSQVPPLPLE